MRVALRQTQRAQVEINKTLVAELILYCFVSPFFVFVANVAVRIEGSHGNRSDHLPAPASLPGNPTVLVATKSDGTIKSPPPSTR